MVPHGGKGPALARVLARAGVPYMMPRANVPIVADSPCRLDMPYGRAVQGEDSGACHGCQQCRTAWRRRGLQGLRNALIRGRCCMYGYDCHCRWSPLCPTPRGKMLTRSCQ